MQADLGPAYASHGLADGVVLTTRKEGEMCASDLMKRGRGVRGFVDNAADEYAIEVAGEWRAIVDGVAYCGFASRLEALMFVAAKYADLTYRGDFGSPTGDDLHAG